MSKSKYQAKIILKTAQYLTETGNWSVKLAFNDGDGLNTPYGLAIGDVIALDTNGYEPATITNYSIETITSRKFNEVTVTLKYLVSNDNTEGEPDLEFSIDSLGFVTRPSVKSRLLPVPSPGIQLLPDKFSFYTLNNNLLDILDDSQPVKLITVKGLSVDSAGVVQLPSKPIGDILLDLALVKLTDGSFVEFTDLNLDSTGTIAYLNLSLTDLSVFEGLVSSVTVSYLTKL